jgi:HAD superfamily hydrolase (TIGR01490 family)
MTQAMINTTMTNKLAIFDLDNTLIGGDSDHAFGQFLIEQGMVDAQLHAQVNDAFYEDYKAGTLDIIAYQRFALAPLVGLSVAALDSLHQGFMQTVIHKLELPKARQLIEQHRALGHRLLVITATNRFVTAPIVAWLGIDELIATEPSMTAKGEILGDVSGIPSFQEGKIQRLDTWLAEQTETFDETWFYSDSRNDLPLLKRVTHPVAVDPDEVLRDYAEQAGWVVMSLRD